MMGQIAGVPDTVIELALVALAVAIVLAFIRRRIGIGRRTQQI